MGSIICVEVRAAALTLWRALQSHQRIFRVVELVPGSLQLLEGTLKPLELLPGEMENRNQVLE